MKKLISLLLGIAMMTMGASLAEGALVTYFSHAGENYNVGVIEEGNTAKLAKVIAEQTGADLFEIVPVVDYPQSYDECLEVATAEQREGARPEYVGGVENWDQYGTVLLGFPIWYYAAPNVVNTFCKAYDWAGKRVVLFATSGGSDIGKTAQKLRPYLRGDPEILSAGVYHSIGELKAAVEKVL